jgi:predicted RNA-binding protein with RPS1 domain
VAKQKHIPNLKNTILKPQQVHVQELTIQPRIRLWVLMVRRQQRRPKKKAKTKPRKRRERKKKKSPKRRRRK